MSVEIERKFLVKNDDFKKVSFQQKTLKQGYLNSDKNRTVRIRISDNQAFITVKGISNDAGTIRFEWEKEIDIKEATEMLSLCEPTIIDKTRFLVKNGTHIFEIDEFYGENKGLIVAEIELNSEDESFEKPTWLGKEVTGIKKYYNANLSKFPFCDWK
ncbi:MAG: CYTH domain-containing protein [Flavobacteriia bacterium]|nr:CYTH domain-containing protein [Flavobacteriia bacterium]OIP46373.1 MAG: adenylate cyclase [Flavobacteriaceae bacterium CG2_30_31_66]PIV95738.1 MAG: adenylate cyclase [Flavobacteriaceae bacterium CG17_big_fil_post_rev_8_21_14_2_50_31_13]PIY15637.1 MAG: adenylate cyclase [Flavobacteriaceae bacterium CG_4_10_14_3_um_filter_31_253]PIZ09308.1 MAG: adenylate cyclase [Flavobacteriaceae bacterium CG_4_10_14_0_8_um_filter_31_99]PJC09223.1 MAG: adenylate cyclase [Flavobacteriaceae bacterium CG_4_9_1